MSAFEVGLVFVGGEDLRVGEVTVVADVLQVDVGGNAETAGGDLPVACAGTGPAAVFLLVGSVDLLGDRCGDPPFGVSVGQGRGGRFLSGDACFDPAARAGEFGLQRFDRSDTGLGSGLPGRGVAGGFGRGMHPHDPVALGGGRRCRGDGVDLVRFVRVSAGTNGGPDPVGGVILHVLTKRFVFGPGPGQHGHEPSASPVDVAHRLAGTQFGVRYVKEIGSTQKVSQPVPGWNVGGIIAGVAVGEAVGYRHRPIVTDRQDPDELLQVGPVSEQRTTQDRDRAQGHRP